MLENLIKNDEVTNAEDVTQKPEGKEIEEIFSPDIEIQDTELLQEDSVFMADDTQNKDEVDSAKQNIVPQNDDAISVGATDGERIASLINTQNSRTGSQKNTSKQEKKIEVIGQVSEEIQRDESKILSNKEKINENLRKLKKYKRTEEILWATVYGIESVVGNLHIVAIWNGINIDFTKASYFEPTFSFGRDYDLLEGKEKINRELIFARYQIGSHIPFVVSNVLESKITEGKRKGETITTIVGDRVQAMKKLRSHYFHGEKCLVEVGNLAKAHVLAVRSDWVLVECLGVETLMDSYSLNDQRVDNCSDFVKPGDTIQVRVRKLHLNDDGTVYLAVTGRLFVAPEVIANMKKGGTYLGTVDAYNKNKHNYSVILMNQVYAVIPAKEVIYNVPLTVGDKVNVKVINILETHVIGSAMKL